MTLDTITSAFKQIDKIPGVIKTFIIVILFGVLLINYIKTQNERILRQYTLFTEIKEQKAEEYTLATASDINNCINDIAIKDTAAYNVLLLSYHNTQKSLQGYRYLFLNCLTEKPKGLEGETLKEYWTNLEYIYYEDELSKIHNQEYLRISNIEKIRSTMPKIYKRLKMSGAKAAAFYTIEGVKNPIGMIVVLYNTPKTYYVGYYPEVVAHDIQKLAVILDYQNVNQTVQKNGN